MGGKVWSEEEERVFWTEIVPSSTKRHLMARPYPNDPKGWASLSNVMRRSMGHRARRKYTALTLYEHYFQNSVLEHFSPHARPYVLEYIREERATAGQAPRERSRTKMCPVQRGRRQAKGQPEGQPEAQTEPQPKFQPDCQPDRHPVPFPPLQPALPDNCRTLPPPLATLPVTTCTPAFVSALCEPDYGEPIEAVPDCDHDPTAAPVKQEHAAAWGRSAGVLFKREESV